MTSNSIIDSCDFFPSEVLLASTLGLDGAVLYALRRAGLLLLLSVDCLDDVAQGPLTHGVRAPRVFPRRILPETVALEPDRAFAGGGKRSTATVQHGR